MDTTAIYVIFILSSAELDITLLASIGIVGIVYLISRSIGKYFGSYLGAKIVHADNNVKNIWVLRCCHKLVWLLAWLKWFQANFQLLTPILLSKL